jgi:hypothetical protein
MFRSLKQISDANQPLLNEPRVVMKISMHVVSLKAITLSTIYSHTISSTSYKMVAMLGAGDKTTA